MPPKLGDLQEIPNAAQPTAGMGLALDVNGLIPPTVTRRQAIQISGNGPSVNSATFTAMSGGAQQIFDPLGMIAYDSSTGTVSFNGAPGLPTFVAGTGHVPVFWVDVDAEITWATTSLTNGRLASIFLNGTEYRRSYQPGTYSGSPLGVHATQALVGAGQSVQLKGYQDSGVALTTTYVLVVSVFY